MEPQPPTGDFRSSRTDGGHSKPATDDLDRDETLFLVKKPTFPLGRRQPQIRASLYFWWSCLIAHPSCDFQWPSLAVCPILSNLPATLPTVVSIFFLHIPQSFNIFVLRFSRDRIHHDKAYSVVPCRLLLLFILFKIPGPIMI